MDKLPGRAVAPLIRKLCSAASLSALALLQLAGTGWCAQSEPGTAPVAPASASLDEKTGPARLQEQRRVTVETNPSSASTGEEPKPKRFEWDATWKGWDGLHLDLTLKTKLSQHVSSLTNVHVVSLEETRMAGKIGAKVALDGATYLTSDEFEDFDTGVELRRARLFAKGDCLLLLPVSYQLEIGYIPDEFYIEESYLAFKNISYLGQLKLGQYQTPMGLDIINSTRDITLMEPAAPLQALAPGVDAGVQLGRSVLNDRATWAFGLFTDGVGQDFGDASEHYGRAIIRFSGLPIDRPGSESPESAQPPSLLHLGLSANILYSTSETVRYQARPESHLAPHVVDTGTIESQGALVLGAETAWVNGPFSVQGEILHSFVDRKAGESLEFLGFYGSVSWFLTGESRPYNRADGCFGRIIPKRPLTEGGWGAWEIGGRYSFVDLADADIQGGRLNMIMAGVNWYPHSHIKWRFNYGFGRVSDTDPDGNVNVFQTRVEVDF